ncbi:MAG TPA: MCP four helix bundle domain-containing protein [Lacunisphaera sp.]|nr:MCP four helix bundle domain-containing protein [Lacunisphaera sp.]
MQFGRLRFFLIVALLVSNLMVGLGSLWFLRSMDRRYAALYDRSVPVLNHLRTLTRELSTVQRLARRVSDPRNEPEWAALVTQLSEGSDAARAHGERIGGMELLKNSPHYANLRNAGREYDNRVDEFLALVRADKLSEASQFNIAMLRPTYDRYMDLLDDVAVYVDREGNNLRARYAEESKRFGGLLLAFAGWPLLAAGVVIVIVTLLVLGLFVAVFFPRLFADRSNPT